MLFLKEKVRNMIVDQIITKMKTQDRTIESSVINLDPASESRNNPIPSNRIEERKSFFKRKRFRRHDSNFKSAMKAFSWRMVGTLDTIIVSYLVTKRFTLAISIGGIEVFTKIFLYYLHERIWTKVRL